MAGASKSTPLMAKDSERSTVLDGYFSNEESEQSEQSESSTTESDDSVSDATDIEGDVVNEKAGSSVDSDHLKELIRKITEIVQGTTSEKGSYQPKMLKSNSSMLSQGSGDFARAASCASRNAASSCRRVTYAACDAITEGKVRLDKALRKAEGAGKLDDLDRYRALESKYDVAFKVAAGRARLIEAVVGVAEGAAKAAENAAEQMAQETNEVSTATEIVEVPNEALTEKVSVTRTAAINAYIAAIVAYKAEYLSMTGIKSCWEDLDFGNVVTRRYPTRNPEKTRRSKNEIICGVIAVLFILCIGLLAAVLPYKNYPEHRTSIVTVGGILLSMPVCALICQIAACYLGTDDKRVKTINIITRIDDRIRMLQNYFVRNNMAPFLSNNQCLAALIPNK